MSLYNLHILSDLRHHSNLIFTCGVKFDAKDVKTRLVAIVKNKKTLLS